MRKIYLAMALLLLTLAATAQKTNTHPRPYATVDKKALELPESQTGATQGIADYVKTNFATDSDKTRAVFIWLASNIQYDADNMFALNFYETEEEKITKALKTRKGICANYAAIFTDVCQKTGVQAYVVGGYTKQNGFADYIPHAWCAAQVSGNWFLFDPTWGSGYISNGKFVKRIDNSYYKVPPSKFIKSHMPFDPMWELLNYPVTNQEFYDGKVQENKSKPYFSYTDSIAEYEKLEKMDQYIAESRRLEANGVKNSLIYDRLQHLQREIEMDKNKRMAEVQNAKTEEYNNAVNEYNEGVVNFNIFIEYRNKQFKPVKPDEEIQAMFDAGYNKFVSAKDKLAGIKDPDERLAAMMVPIKKTVDDAVTRADEQKAWLAKYFSKGKFGRSTMFTKYTWMGVPLN